MGTVKIGAGRFHAFGFQEHGLAKESGLRVELNTSEAIHKLRSLGA